jgi:hypothetical protein
VYYFSYYLYSLFPALLFRRCELWKCSRPSRRRLWAVASRESRQVFLNHVDAILLSPAVLSCRTNLSIFMMLILACVESVGLPSVVMWGDRGEVRCCGLSKVWNGGEGCDPHGLWLDLLKLAKDRFLEVDPPGQHVPPRVRYGMVCWLIRKALVSLYCWMSGPGMAIPRRPQGARGAWGYSIVSNIGKP